MIRWCGSHAAAPSSTKVLGVRIRLAEDLRIYRPCKHAVPTQAYVRAEPTASLWANGFTPRLQIYPGWKAPNGLLVDVWRGHPSINTVSEDLLALTKLNYNASIYGDDQPVTLSFADVVGEILTAGPVSGAPLPFEISRRRFIGLLNPIRSQVIQRIQAEYVEMPGLTLPQAPASGHERRSVEAAIV